MNSVSTPPLDSVKPPKAVTFADVAMKLAQDGPIYAIIGLVGAMALGGHATASEAVITGLAGLLARMWPQAVQVAGKVGAQLIIILAAGTAFSAVHIACSPPEHITYGGELAACTAAAKARQTKGVITRDEACQESIQCENAVRSRQNPPRPPRTTSLDCK